MFKDISRYAQIVEPGNILSVKQTIIDKSNEAYYTISGNVITPKLGWKNSVIEVSYSYNNSSAKSYYRCCYLTEYNPDYLLKSMDTSNSMYNTDMHNGVLFSNDLKILWGKLPPKLSSLRRSIFDYVVDKHEDLSYTKEYHWARAFTYCLQLMSSYGIISYYRYLQPIHCKDYDLINSLEIPGIITPNFIAEQGQTLTTLVADCKKELQDLGIPLNTLSSLRDFVDSNPGTGTLLEGVCLLILATLTKPEEYNTWIH